MSTNGIIPTDLKQITLTPEHWVRLSTEERVKLVKNTNHTLSFKAVTMAITLWEYNSSRPAPLWNFSGLMVWARVKHWGWAKYWRLPAQKDKDFLPVGYYLAREGQTGNTGVFFSFRSFLHCFNATYKIVEGKNIKNGYDYEKEWVGRDNPQPNIAFDKVRDRVAQMMM